MSSKIVITRKEDNTIIFIADSAIETPVGLKVSIAESEFIIGFSGDCLVHNVDNIAPGIAPQEYKYLPSEGFVKNENYIKPFIPELAQKETDERLALVEQAFLDMMGV